MKFDKDYPDTYDKYVTKKAKYVLTKSEIQAEA